MPPSTTSPNAPAAPSPADGWHAVMRLPPPLSAANALEGLSPGATYNVTVACQPPSPPLTPAALVFSAAAGSGLVAVG